MKSEHRWLGALPPCFGATRPDVLVGIGDDAAVLAPSPMASLLTVDAAVEGVHFTRAIASFYDVGYRSFVAAASDIAAMAGRPRAALSALTVPPDVGEVELDALVAGQADAARAIGVAIVGGNVATGPCLSVTTTVIGECERAVERGGARPGEGLYVWGALGLAAAGLQALLRGEAAGPELREAIEAWRRPRAQIEEAWAVRELVSAAIDVSDGLGQDAGHLARVSGVRLVLEEARVLEQGGGALAVAAAKLGLNPIALALAGGEDYALLVTSGHDLSLYGGRLIGRVEAGPREVLVEGPLGRRLAPAGFDHGQGTPNAARGA
ncbi:MAG: thiamine-phosphate kinase [Polyangiaceae bacterium]|nr:thiamine-phosphate kinase [Polyangiaceae bacterium]